MQTREECPDEQTLCADVVVPPGASIEYQCCYCDEDASWTKLFLVCHGAAPGSPPDAACEADPP